MARGRRMVKGNGLMTTINDCHLAGEQGLSHKIQDTQLHLNFIILKYVPNITWDTLPALSTSTVTGGSLITLGSDINRTEWRSGEFEVGFCPQLCFGTFIFHRHGSSSLCLHHRNGNRCVSFRTRLFHNEKASTFPTPHT